MTCLITSIWIGLLIAFLLGLLLGLWLCRCCKKKSDCEPKAGVLPSGIKQDDLTIVEGIGPKISEILQNGGIRTWKDLSEARVERIQELLNNAGSRFKLAKPGTWSKQAEMAYKGQWNELQKWQDELDGGVDKS